MARTKITRLDPGHKNQIRYLVGNLHVGVPDAEVAELWRKKCLKAGATPGVAKQCAETAVAEHQENRKLYIRVQGGRLGRSHR